MPVGITGKSRPEYWSIAARKIFRSPSHIIIIVTFLLPYRNFSGLLQTFSNNSTSPTTNLNSGEWIFPKFWSTIDRLLSSTRKPCSQSSIFSLFYISWYYILFYTIKKWKNKKTKKNFIMTRILVFVCSSLNPLLYLWRIKIIGMK